MIKSDGCLAGRVAVVTGAASGIGGAVAERFVAEGAYVVAADLNPAVLDAEPARWQAVKCDVSDEGNLAGTVEAADAAGPLGILVNCAGISVKIPIDEISAAQWQRVVDVNLNGSALAIKHAVPVMKRNGGGSIVNIASLAAYSTASVHNNVYAATKGAIVSLTRALVYELSPFNIRINAVAPGIIRTPILDGHGAEWLAERARQIPLGRLGGVDEMASVVTFLASDASSYITGQTIVADGGMTSVMYSASAQK
jgi:NAD(P)-dependent dehydrogenase (short-subunit alcohol dehydrogenase family)